MDFVDWPLHDAVIRKLTFDWASGTCEITVTCLVGRAGTWDAEARGEISERAATTCCLRFGGVRELRVPRVAPWGRSVHLNGQRRGPDGTYEIEMQSGDVIVIAAESATCEIDT